MTFFLVIASSYEHVYIALCHDNTLIETLTIHKHEASKKLIPTIDTILMNNNKSLANLSFIGVNQGPGPFTTLRTVITTVNGISFAVGTPLIGVNSLNALLQEYKNPDYAHTIALLNAFGNDVYFGTEHEQGYQNIHVLLEKFKQRYDNKVIRFLGNGTALYKKEIKDTFGAQAFIPSPSPDHCSIQHIATIVFEKWQQQRNITHQILPLYIKQQQFYK